MKLVYLAEDLRLAGRPCALAEMVDALTNPESQRQAASNFQREANMLAQLSNEHIPRIYDFFSETNHHFLVMEYIDGTTLEQALAEAGGRLPELRVIDIAVQVLETIEYLHGLTPPVIYRDLKPSNVMLSRAGGVMLIDFGIARHFQPQSNVTMIGTQGYAPPEQYRGRVEARSDLYALGATMHHALTGRDPATEAPFSFPPLAKLRPDLPATLCGLVDQTLSYEVERRVPTAVDFRRRLLEIRAQMSAPSARTASSAGAGAAAAAPASAGETPGLRVQLSASEAPTAEFAREINCYRCGGSLPTDSAFCSFCGTDLRRILAPHEVMTDSAVTAPISLPPSGSPRPRPGIHHPVQRHAARRRAILALTLIFMLAFLITRLTERLASRPSPPSNEGGYVPGAPPGPAAPPPFDASAQLRARILRQALDREGYSGVRFRFDRDTIVLWGTVPTESDRAMVQMTVFTIMHVYSLEDHIQVTGGLSSR